jgi:hypothetical protein
LATKKNTLPKRAAPIKSMAKRKAAKPKKIIETPLPKRGALKAKIKTGVRKKPAKKEVRISATKRSTPKSKTPVKVAVKTPRSQQKASKKPFSFVLPVSEPKERKSHFEWTEAFLQEMKSKIHVLNEIVLQLDEYKDYEAMQTFFEDLFDLRRSIDGKLKLFRQNEAKKELEKIFSL